jgi:hypothetical protein
VSDQVIELITQMKESLEREMHQGFARIEERFRDLTARFEAQSARLDRQAAMIQAGSRALTKIDAWADRTIRPSIQP